MPKGYDRDLIGYAGNPPDAKWPGGARLALNFVLNYEEGSEPSIQDGEGFTETALGEGSSINQPVKGRDLAGEGMFNFGSRVGFWRISRLFAARNLPITVFGCALALERNPPAAAEIKRLGFDICCHGWRWVKHYELTEAEEREHIRKAVASLKASMGERPLGWYCRYGPSVSTRRLVVEEGGFLYDSDCYDDEFPYWVTVSGKPHLVVPYTLTNNDTKFASGAIGTAADFFTYLKDSFDVLYREGRMKPQMMSVGMHMRILGHAARAGGLEKFIDYAMGHAGVWITRRLDIAQHWAKTHPYPGKGLNE